MQEFLFGKNYPTSFPARCNGLDVELKESKAIVDKAIADTNPYAVCLMLSGGDDSVTALHVAMMLGLKIDFIIHGVTGTGLPVVRQYVNDLAAKKGIPLVEANAGTTFEDYVMRKGFFGRGGQAHKFSYHLLKWNPFRAALSKHIRHKKPNRKIILLNGVRVEESDNRLDNFGDDPYRWVDSNLWVNIIHWWSKKQCLALLEAEGVERNPAAVALGRSCECNCGTMQTEADRIAISAYDPVWGKWMADLRKIVTAKFGWDIWEQPNKKRLEEINRKAGQIDDYLPMCVGCKAKTRTLNLF